MAGRGNCLLAIEALEVLALRPGATPVQIKEAYRDLVKVWHPDRFGSDARLGAKAEEKLQRINEAYLVLQSDVGAVPSYRGRAGSTIRADVSSPRYSSYTPVVARRGGGSNRVVMGWFYICVGISVLLVGYLVILNPAKITEPTVPAVVLNPVVPRTPGGVSGGRVARPAEASPRGSDAGSSTGAAQFSGAFFVGG